MDIASVEDIKYGYIATKTNPSLDTTNTTEICSDSAENMDIFPHK